MALRALTPREASIFACLADAVVSPRPLLPAVRDTDAVAFFDTWMARSPRLNRIGFRALLYLVELWPIAGGYRRRMRRLGREERALYLLGLERAPAAQVRQVAKLIKGMAFLSYYGDDAVMRRVGYDADANVARGRELRAREGRP